MKFKSENEIQNFMAEIEKQKEKVRETVVNFVLERCDIRISKSTPYKELYADYEKWEKHQYILDYRGFNKNIKRLGVKTARKKDGYHWVGLKLIDTHQD